jgi:hypothetical protein
MEAMPPAMTRNNTSTATGPHAFSSASLHPVFFTSTLRKPPFSLPGILNPANYNPVALGYLAESAVKKSTNKL